MTEIRHILLILIKSIEIIPIILFINCILKAMSSRKQQPYDHPEQLTIFQIQQPKPVTDRAQVDTNSQHRIYTKAYQPLPDPWLLPLDIAAFSTRSPSAWLCVPLTKQPPQKLLLLPPAKEHSVYSKMNSVTLRSHCSKKGIKWRGVRGGKHLTKPEMIERFTTLSA